MSPPNLVGFELIVARIDDALALFVDALGLELVDRYLTTDPVGEIAIIDAGSVAITLLQPGDAGPGHVLPKRDPRLSQIIFAVETARVGEVANQVAERGLTAQSLDDARFFISPATCEGALGIQTAVVVTDVSDGAGTGDGLGTELDT